VSGVDTYKGESWPKKLARAHFWLSACVLLPEFRGSPILCLASREGGDISVLKGLGVDPRNIVAVDICEEAAAAAKTLHPDVDIRCMDVADVIAQRDGFLVSLLDFCGPISVAIARTIAAVAKKTRATGLLGVALLKGRETRVARNFLDSEFRTAYAADKDNRLTRALARRGVEVRLRYEDEGWNREVLVSSLVEEADKTVLLQSIAAISYQSITKKNRGVPMMLTVFMPKRLNRYSLAKSKLRAMKSFNEYVRLSLFAQLAEMGEVERNRWLSSDTPPPAPLDKEVPTSLDACKLEAVRILIAAKQHGVNGPAILNISRGEAAALLAHHTMGTYDEGRE
jgi:hypothetical protein